MRSLGRRRWYIATLLGAALAAAPAAVAHAQTGKLTGTVIDKETGKPVPNVQVRIEGTTLGDLTKDNGRFFIISVPPGVYTVSARRIGYQTVNTENVSIAIDVTRELNITMQASTQTLAAVTVQAQQTPLVERGQVGSTTMITAEQIQSLPVTSIAGVLALQQGFQEIAANTNVISLAEEQRSTTSPIRVRGGRGGSTLSLVDGVPVNNPIFGSNAITLSSFAVQATSLTRGGMDPQYGNALGSTINNSVREGGSQVIGSINFQNTTLPGQIFGTLQDKLAGSNVFRGYLAGPVPGTSARIRYSVAGEVSSGAGRVLKYDNDIFSVNEDMDRRETLAPWSRDLIPGWQAFGGTQNQQIVGKLTFLPFDNTKINVTAIGAERQNRPYDRRYWVAYQGNPLDLVNNRADSLYQLSDNGFMVARDMSQPSVRDRGQFLSGQIQQRFGRSNLQISFGQIDFERVTCPVFRGTCLPAPFCRANFSQGFLNASPSLCATVPDQGGGDQVYGGESFTDRTIRVDLQSQITDHNNIQFGGSYTAHDFVYEDQLAAPGNSGISPTMYLTYRAKPYDAAAYLQSVIEYDFLTVRLGGRFDYGVARGLGFTNPLDPANGTTAREVCDGATVAGNRLLNAQGQPYTIAGCMQSEPDPVTKRPVLLDSATKLAALDDFSPAKARAAFSPRVGVNFPLTDRSQVFFNVGRYTMVPAYGNTYRYTGIGTIAGTKAEGGDEICAKSQVKPGTTECIPNIQTTNPSFVGNPNLLLEEAVGYEMGFSATLGEDQNYGIQLAVYNRSETGLSGSRRSRAVNDVGSTYDGSLPVYNVLVNGDYLTSRGVEVSLDRRLANRWSFGVNYGISRATSNAMEPERQNEVDRTEASRLIIRESLVASTGTHSFNANLGVRIGTDIPELPYNAGRFLKNTSMSTTFSFRSGAPYTPTRATTLGNSSGSTSNASDVFSGRMPSTMDVGLMLDKRFTIQNVSYSGFIRVSNLFDRINCVQVFANTGTCVAGLREFLNRRVGNTGDVTTSTGYDQPEYIGARRQLFTGLSVNF